MNLKIVVITRYDVENVYEVKMKYIRRNRYFE